jgi:hypothetical protein
MLLMGAGLLKIVGGKLQLSPPTVEPIISFYWVVPPGRFGDWRKKAAKAVDRPAAKAVDGRNSQDVKEWNVVSECWKRHVVQYCLEVPFEAEVV